MILMIILFPMISLSLCSWMTIFGFYLKLEEKAWNRSVVLSLLMFYLFWILKKFLTKIKGYFLCINWCKSVLAQAYTHAITAEKVTFTLHPFFMSRPWQKRRIFGHKKGAKTVRKITTACAERNHHIVLLLRFLIL